MESAIVIPENQEIKQEVTDITAQALALTITDNTSYAVAGELFTLHRQMEKKIEDFFAPHVEAAHKVHKGLTAARAAEIAKLTPGKTYLNQIMTAWNIAQEKIRRAEEDELRKKAKIAEEEARIQAALQAEAEGSHEEAAAIIETPVFVPPPVVAKTVPKVEGATIRTTWKHTVTDLKALCKAVAEGKAPITCIQANDVFLGQMARNGKGNIQYPGVSFYEEKSMTGARTK